MTDQSSLATFSDLVGRIEPPTPAQVAAARRQVAIYAHDTADAAMLLDALGIGDAA